MRTLLLSVALVVFWSSGFVGAELGTSYAPATTLLAWRYAAAALVLGLVALVTGERFGAAAWRRQGVLGILCQCGYLGGVVTGVGLGVPAGTAALIAAAQPLLVAAVAGPLLGEQTGRRQYVGLVIGLAGVAWVVAGDVGLGDAPGWAFLLPAGGMAALAAGTVLERRMRPAESPMQALTLQTAVAAGVFVVAAATGGQLAPPADPGFWWAVAWVVVVLSSFGGYGAYLLVLRTSGAVRVSALLYLTPPTTAVWAYLMFGERPGPFALPGGLLCAAGVALVLARSSETVGPPAHDGTHDPARRILPRHP